MKKLVMSLIVFFTVISSYAQFEQGKYYIGTSFSGFDLSYSGSEDLNLGLEAKAGYLVADNWMLLAQAGFNYNGNDDIPNYASVGVGGRYYVIQNGLYLGVNTKLIHSNHNYNDLMPGIEIGYAFFLNKTVTIEPAVYYDQSFRNHSDYSKFGLRIGIGVYL